MRRTATTRICERCSHFHTDYCGWKARVKDHSPPHSITLPPTTCPLPRPGVPEQLTMRRTNHTNCARNGGDDDDAIWLVDMKHCYRKPQKPLSRFMIIRLGVVCNSHDTTCGIILTFILICKLIVLNEYIHNCCTWLTPRFSVHCVQDIILNTHIWSARFSACGFERRGLVHVVLIVNSVCCVRSILGHNTLYSNTHYTETDQIGSGSLWLSISVSTANRR